MTEPTPKPEHEVRAYTDALGITTPEPLDPYIEKKLDEAISAIQQNMTDYVKANSDFTKWRNSLRPILEKMWKEAYNEGEESAEANQDDEPEPPDREGYDDR